MASGLVHVYFLVLFKSSPVPDWISFVGHMFDTPAVTLPITPPIRCIEVELD